jgi:hypothetical protein
LRIAWAKVVHDPNLKTEGTRGMAQAVQCLPVKLKPFSSIPNTAKKIIMMLKK